MIAFEVSINGRKLAIASVNKLMLLSVMLHWVDKRGSCDFDFRGMTEEKGFAEHLVWLEKQLKVGDELKIRIVESSVSSKTKRRSRAR